MENNRLTAELIEKIPLSLRDRHTFVQAPVNALIDKVAEMLQIFATAHSKGQDCDIQKFIDLDFDLAKKDLALLRDLEITHNILTLYSWLSLRFPNTFTNLTGAVVLKTDCEALINTCLADLAFTRQKRRRVFYEEMESIEEQEAREKEEQEIKPIFMEGHDPAQKPPSP
jgi:hypothetical protein